MYTSTEIITKKDNEPWVYPFEDNTEFYGQAVIDAIIKPYVLSFIGLDGVYPELRTKTYNENTLTIVHFFESKEKCDALLGNGKESSIISLFKKKMQEHSVEYAISRLDGYVIEVPDPHVKINPMTKRLDLFYPDQIDRPLDIPITIL